MFIFLFELFYNQKYKAFLHHYYFQSRQALFKTLAWHNLTLTLVLWTNLSMLEVQNVGILLYSSGTISQYSFVKKQWVTSWSEII